MPKMPAEKDRTMAKVYIMAFFPLVILSLYFAMMFCDRGLFIYTIGGTEYSLGAVGYLVNGVQAIKPGYTTPATWPKPIRGIPKLLIAHLSVAVILSVYLTVYLTVLWTLMRQRRAKYPDKAKRDAGGGISTIKPLADQKGDLKFVIPVVLLIVGSLIAADLAVVILSFQAGDVAQSFQPTPTGYGLGITAGLLAVIWGILWIVFISVAPRTAAASKKAASSSSSSSSSRNPKSSSR